MTALWSAVDPIHVVVESGSESIWSQWGGLLAVLVGALAAGIAQVVTVLVRSKREIAAELRVRQYAAYIANVRAAETLSHCVSMYVDTIEDSRAPAAATTPVDLDGPAEQLSDAVAGWGLTFVEVRVLASKQMCGAQDVIRDAVSAIGGLGRSGELAALKAQARLASDGYGAVVDAMRADLGVDRLLVDRKGRSR